MPEKTLEIIEGGTDEIVRKKSRFIGKLVRVTSEEEALAEIEAARKVHYNARHNCFAYIIDGEKAGLPTDLMRSSDDGEPSQTAGKQIADSLSNRGLTNALCIVTRYFGGVLLGTGGLSSAYRDAALSAIDASVLAERQAGKRCTIVSDYNDYGKIDYLLRQKEIPVTASDFGAEVTLSCICPEDLPLESLVTDAVSGRARFSEGEEVIYAFADGKLIFL